MRHGRRAFELGRGSDLLLKFRPVSLVVKVLLLILVFALGGRGEIPAAAPGAEGADAPANLRFSAYDGDPKSTDPKEMTFQISQSAPRKTEFLKLGQTFGGTRFKLVKFEYKVRIDPGGEPKDVSELTLLDADTGKTFVLARGGR